MSILNKIEANLQAQNDQKRGTYKTLRLNKSELQILKELEEITGLDSSKVIRLALQELINNKNNPNQI